MNDERWFRFAMIALFTCFTLIRVYYRRTYSASRRAAASSRVRGADAYLLNVLLAYEVITLALYVLTPWLGWAALLLPAWLRWLGAVLGLISLLGFVWVHECLGANFDRNLSIHQEQTLVTHGPYRWMRHPMYTAFGLLHLASFLISANGFIGATWLGGLALLLAIRVPREERMLAAAFGADYVRYMARTRRFGPRLRLPAPRPARTPGSKGRSADVSD